MSRRQREQLDEILRHGEFDIGGDVDEQRVIFHEMISSVPLPGDIVTTPGELGGVPVITVETPDNDPAVVVLYFHGGGYALGSAPDSVGLAADVARRVGARAITVDYRLAPEHRYPAAVTDAVAAYPVCRRCSSRPDRTRSFSTTPSGLRPAPPRTTYWYSCRCGRRCRTSSKGLPHFSTRAPRRSTPLLLLPGRTGEPSSPRPAPWSAIIAT